MNEREKRFVFELLKDPNITGEQAAINAGYSAKSARSKASQLLTKVNIQASLNQARQDIAKKNQITLDELVEEMKLFAFAKIPDIIEWNDSNVGFRPSDKIKAIESIGKMLGLITDKHDVTIRKENEAIEVESEVLRQIIDASED